MADPRTRARWAYEARRLRSALPMLFIGAVLLAVAWWVQATNWPWALGVGVLATAGHFKGLDIGRGAVIGAVIGAAGALAMLGYSNVGCCGSTCGSCGVWCGAVCVSAGALVGLFVRTTPAGLLGGAGVLLVACSLGTVALGSGWGPLGAGLTAAILVWFGRRWVS